MTEPPDPGGPVFFLSYARARSSRPGPREHDDPVRRFFTDLNDNISQLIALPPGQDAGFLDTSMESGQRWREPILTAVGTCQVFVALLSARYLDGSQWCAMEWDAFARREITSPSGQTDRPTAIVPVLWTPIHRQLPLLVAKVQRFHLEHVPRDDLVSRYESDGLYALMRTDRDGYYTVVWRLAVRIAQLYSTHRVEPEIPNATIGLRTSFEAAE